MTGKIKKAVVVTGTVAVVLASAFLLGKNLKNQMSIERVDNEISVMEITTEAPTLMTEEQKLTAVNISIPDYIVNEKSKKFHFPDCYSIGTMSEENKIYYNGSREELTEQGYEPCKKCCP